MKIIPIPIRRIVVNTARVERGVQETIQYKEHLISIIEEELKEERKNKFSQNTNPLT